MLFMHIYVYKKIFCLLNFLFFVFKVLLEECCHSSLIYASMSSLGVLEFNSCYSTQYYYYYYKYLVVEVVVKVANEY